MSNVDTRPRNGLRISEIDLCAWLGQAVPGDILEYHRGNLALDASPHNGSLGDQERKEIDRVARRAWWAAERQLVHLVQRRRGTNLFSYLLIARPRPKVASPSSSSPLLKDAWPNTIRAAFEPAHTVETGKLSYRFENIKGDL
jgi:hypothetical protein